MRRAVLVNAVVITALVLGSAAGGCTCGKDGEKKKAESPPTSRVPRMPGDPAMAGKRTQALRNLQLAPITLEDVEPLIPSLPGATPVGKPGVMTQGRQVKAVFCMASPTADAVMSQLVAAASSLGFTEVKTRTHPRNQEMITMHGEKGAIRLGGTVQRGKTPDCPGDQGKIKIVLSYFKRTGGEESEAAEAPPP
jgi:hypothetical protein